MPPRSGRGGFVKSFDELADEFLAASKAATYQPRWRRGGHRDFVASTMRVSMVGPPSLSGRVCVSAHILAMPPKYSFALVFRGVFVA